MCPAPLTCACVYFSGVLCRLCPMKAADEGIYTGERGNFLPLSHRNGLSRRDSPLERKHGGFSFPERAGIWNECFMAEISAIHFVNYCSDKKEEKVCTDVVEATKQIETRQ